jgi:hypothetical protein
MCVCSLRELFERTPLEIGPSDREEKGEWDRKIGRIGRKREEGSITLSQTMMRFQNPITASSPGVSGKARQALVSLRATT